VLYLVDLCHGFATRGIIEPPHGVLKPDFRRVQVRRSLRQIRVTALLASVSIPIIVPVLLLLPIPIPTIAPIILGPTRCHRRSEKHGDEKRCKILHVHSLETV
jgi:hypothetical protein